MTEQHSTKFSLLVTGIFLLCLLILAAILKPKRSPEAAAAPERTTTPTPAVAQATAPASQPQTPLPPPPLPAPGDASQPSAADVPSVPAERSKLQILTNCRLKEDPTNDADSFCVQTKSGDYRFSLYFVDAPDTGGSQMEATQVQCRYFGELSEQELRKVAQDAKLFMMEKLRNSTFDVVTRWERSPEESQNQEVTCRAFIFLRGQDDITRVADLLVQNGFAMLCEAKEVLPDYTTPDNYLELLKKFEQIAMNTRRGAWGLSEHVSPVAAKGVAR
ncbi:MAG: hypothetical protein KA004_19160 [Verrucomicrobiales bacterium]|nr:hypothetical protein [Verrucomicrobiales bacterium]